MVADPIAPTWRSEPLDLPDRDQAVKLLHGFLLDCALSDEGSLECWFDDVELKWRFNSSFSADEHLLCHLIETGILDGRSEVGPGKGFAYAARSIAGMHAAAASLDEARIELDAFVKVTAWFIYQHNILPMRRTFLVTDPLWDHVDFVSNRLSWPTFGDAIRSLVTLDLLAIDVPAPSVGQCRFAWTARVRQTLFLS